MTVAIIGGTGLAELTESAVESPRLRTRYGEADAWLLRVGDGDVAYLPRHGPKHSVPPHAINYRANTAALHELGVTRILASNAVGSLREDLQPGRFILPDQLLEFTKRRTDTFHNGDHGPVVHTDFTHPFCDRLRRTVLRAADEQGLAPHDGATYLCLEGPRFETAAEIRLFARWGADLVGMTAYPEAILARELGMCYASVCVVTNLAAGLTTAPVDHQAVEAQMAAHAPQLRQLLLAAAAMELRESAPCHCSTH